jgi:hypothetical protein
LAKQIDALLLGLDFGDVPSRLGSLSFPHRGMTMTEVRVAQFHVVHLVSDLLR